MVTALWALGKSFVVFEWWTPILVFVLGSVLAFVVTFTLKQWTQLLCTLGIFPALFFTVIYVSEEKPLGFLHRLFS